MIRVSSMKVFCGDFQVGFLMIPLVFLWISVIFSGVGFEVGRGHRTIGGPELFWGLLAVACVITLLLLVFTYLRLARFKTIASTVASPGRGPNTSFS